MADITIMPRVAMGSLNEGKTYYKKETLTDPDTESNAIIFPDAPIYAIGVNYDDNDGVGSLEFTMDPLANIQDDSADWFTWDGASEINLASTAWRIKRTSGGPIVAAITIKGRQA